jgi:hypothetical protein
MLRMVHVIVMLVQQGLRVHAFVCYIPTSDSMGKLMLVVAKQRIIIQVAPYAYTVWPQIHVTAADGFY